MELDWNYFKSKLCNSPNNVQIFEKTELASDLPRGNTAMEIIANSISFILVNKYLRILGTSDSLHENIFKFTGEFEEVFGERKYIIANDIFGGLFASEKTIHYFSPDNLQWEDLGVNYEGFINWIAEKDITDFYESFIWDGIDDLVSNVGSEQGIFIYPFLWAKECNVNTAFKKIVPYKDLLVANAQNMPLLAKETEEQN